MPKEVDDALSAVKGEVKKLEAEIGKAKKDGKAVPKAVDDALDSLKKRVEELDRKIKKKV